LSNFHHNHVGIHRNRRRDGAGAQEIRGRHQKAGWQRG
jgi:hypothetical protein